MRSGHDQAFGAQQRPLQLDIAAVAAQPSGGRHDPVAGDVAAAHSRA